jgi:ABC-type phosphate transport system substrate-binding protein
MAVVRIVSEGRILQHSAERRTCQRININYSTESTESTEHEQEHLGIDGSGTTNPQKCFWHIMSKFNEQIKLPTTFSYRGVGSGTGIKEFLGKGIEIDGVETDTYLPYNDFGSGDIPIKKEDYEDAYARGIEIVQLPFVLSAVTFFHSIPDLTDGLSK